MSSSIDADSFAALCEKLRELGATRVEGHGFVAQFPAPLVQATPRPRPSRTEKEEPKTDAEYRELQRQHELGLV